MANDQPQEQWLKWVALTTTILAVCAAIASLKGSSFSTRVQILTTQENNQWSYFQSKSIKQHLFELKRDIFQIELAKDPAPALRARLLDMIKGVDDSIVRYDKEKEEIRLQAEALSKEQVDLKRHGGNFGIAVMLFQIAIMLSAVGALLKKRYAWLAGLLMGFFGLLYFANGFWTFF